MFRTRQLRGPQEPSGLAHCWRGVCSYWFNTTTWDMHLTPKQTPWSLRALSVLPKAVHPPGLFYAWPKAMEVDSFSACGSSLLQESFALLLVAWRGAVCFPLVFATFWLGSREEGEG